jgi:hypothetical protein
MFRQDKKEVLKIEFSMHCSCEYNESTQDLVEMTIVSLSTSRMIFGSILRPQKGSKEVTFISLRVFYRTQ